MRLLDCNTTRLQLSSPKFECVLIDQRCLILKNLGCCISISVALFAEPGVRVTMSTFSSSYIPVLGSGRVRPAQHYNLTG